MFKSRVEQQKHKHWGHNANTLTECEIILTLTPPSIAASRVVKKVAPSSVAAQDLTKLWLLRMFFVVFHLFIEAENVTVLTSSHCCKVEHSDYMLMQEFTQWRKMHSDCLLKAPVWKGSIDKLLLLCPWMGLLYLKPLNWHKEPVLCTEAAMLFTVAQTGQTKLLLSLNLW